MILLILLSAAGGALLGRFYRLHALFPATAAVLAPAGYLGFQQGFVIGLLAFVLSVVALQVCYFASLFAHLAIAFRSAAPHATPSSSEIHLQGSFEP